MRGNNLFLVAVCLFCLVAAGPGSTADATDRRVILGTATQGGGFELYGRHLAATVNGQRPGLDVEAVATRGSRDNLERLERGEIDIGLVEGNAARQALEGVGRPRADLRVLAVMYPNPGMFVVRADSPHHAIDDLIGRPVAFGTRASGLRILADDVLDGLGLSATEDFQPIILDKAGDGPRLVLDGSAAALWGAGIGWPGFVRVADSDVGARFIAPSAQQLDRILAAHPHLRRMSVPAGTYRGQDGPIASVGLWSLVLIRPDVPDAVAYRLAAALHAGEAALAARLAQGRYSTAENTLREVPTERLHRGAARYFADAGLSPE